MQLARDADLPVIPAVRNEDLEIKQYASFILSEDLSMWTELHLPGDRSKREHYYRLY